MNRLILAALVLLCCGTLSPNPLDGTFFPAGIGYEWVYERENYVWEDKVVNSKTRDTLHIKVVSRKASREVRGWTTYELQGGAFEDVEKEITVDTGRVVVFGGQDTLPLVPRPDFKPRQDIVNYGVLVRGDTLRIGLDVGGGYELTLYSTVRLKGVGVLRQEFEIRSPPHYEGHIDRLLYFIKGRDTVWESTP
jgi:hypothetical protein